jgi:uncharacterized protein
MSSAAWPDTLDVETLLSEGWQPAPFRTFVLKIHGRCDLRCDYCYMFTTADQAWRTRPRVMTRATIDAAARRIAEHAGRHDVRDIEITLHGGEPLIAGPELITYAITTIRSNLGQSCRANFGVQTNGLRLGPEFLRVFEELGVTVGISLDGDQAMHDRHRRRPDGGGSYAAAAAAAAALARHPRLFGGILSVIDLRNDPVAAFEALLTFGPPTVDFLLPHGNWSAPPPGRDPESAGAPYGDWLSAVFDRWYQAPAKETGVRLFEEIISLLLGGDSRIEDVGLSPVTVVVIETDGSIEQSDMLRTAYPGAGATGLNVAADALDAALLTAGTAARQLGLRALCEACRACPAVRVCGGGLYPHRYRAGTGFANPSVYCADLYQLISHIRSRLAADLAPAASRPAWR